MSLLTGQGAAADKPGLETLWRAARAGDYHTPDPDELQQATELFRRELAADDPEQLQQDWLALGWQRSRLQLAHGHCHVLHESPERREGRGFYLFCPQAGNRSALQAPHAFKDLHTGRIALALARQGDFAVVAWNTVARNQGDLAHLPQSYFTALTRALATEAETRHVIQLHGFSRQKRSGNGRDAHIILSNGTRHPDRRLFELARRLRAALGVDTRVFPHDIRELGALTNRQGRLLRAAGHAGFLHIELSAETRKRLRNDSASRRAFANNLPGAQGERP